jgi:gliding motility-associated protein GldE
VEIIDPGSSHMVLQVLLNASVYGMTAGITAMLVLLFFSALVSGTETAFFSLSPQQLHELKGSERRTDTTVLHLLERPKTLMATILIANNLLNVAIVIISTYVTGLLFDLDRAAFWVAFLIQVVVLSSLILFFGEIMPKIYASQKNLELARKMAAPMLFLLRLFYPFSIVMVKTTNIIDKRLSKRAYAVSVDDLSEAIELTADGSTPAGEKKILQGIVTFGDIEAREIMTPRTDVSAVEIGLDFMTLLKTAIEVGYSRVPVYSETLDSIKGILYIKDLLPHLDKDAGFEWHQLIREPFFVPENKKISDLLSEFQDKKIHMAIVVDEYGGSSGIITLEDIIEEIVGEISDEHDEPMDKGQFLRLDDRNFLFEGKVQLNDLCKTLELENDTFDEAKGESDTLAGLILELTGKMPERDEEIKYRGFLFTIKAVNKRRIERVRVTLPDTRSGDPDPEG